MDDPLVPESELKRSNPSPRFVFVVMSAVQAPQAIDELAGALAPHLVLVHHDFGQTPDFSLVSPNVRFVPEPKRTGWACWGFCEGIFHALRYAVEKHPFDYLQLLSPTCLPIKPVSAFEQHVAASDCDAHFDHVDLLENRDALMSVGYRAFSPEQSIRHRILRRLSSLYYGGVGAAGLRQIAGVQLRTGFAVDAGGRMKPSARVALRILQASSRRVIGWHLFDVDFPASFGSIWFGARREVVVRMLDRFDDPLVQRFFSRLRISDEFLIPTLLRVSCTRQGPSNHLVNTFVGANPSWFEHADFDRLRRSSKHFARKFRDDPADPIRRTVLDELVGRVSVPATEGIAGRAEAGYAR